MKKTDPMLNNLFCQTKKFLVCLVTISMVLSLNSAFLFNVAKAQTDRPASDMPMEAPPASEGNFVGETPPPSGNMPDMPVSKAGERPMEEPTGLPPEVLQDMEVTMEDLGVKEARIKRDGFLYPAKQLIWNVHEALVFDPVNDAALKLKHANQELADIKQLVDEKGIENMDPAVLTGSIDWFENKLEKIKDASPKIKDQKDEKPEEIETLLNNLTDKQLKEYKVLEEFNEEITKNKDKVERAEDVFAALKDKQDEVLKHFGEVLTTVDEPEKIPERLATIADQQKGSEFKLIKAQEILEKLADQVPEQAKEAIEKAQEKTLAKLQEDMKEMPALVRAEKFEAYTKNLPGDETIQLSIFEKLKQMPDIPQDMLEKIEEVKEFAVKRFEEKVAKFSQPEIQDKFLERFEMPKGDDLDEIMVLEELKNKITAEQETLKKKIEQKHQEGLKAFKKKFTDVKSAEQAKRFEKLVTEMTGNPNPTTFKLIRDLEQELAADPEKKAFVEEIKNKAKSEFENKFRQEGERFFDRMSTLNPADMMVFQQFEKEKFFDSKMTDQFFNHQIEYFKAHLQDIDNPELFDRFQERFRYAPQEVIETINTHDENFGDMMQFKMRKMEEMALELKEREARMKMEQEWMQTEKDFQERLRQTPSDEARKALFEEKRKKDLELVEKEYTERYALMKERMINDPFCDEKCREIQIYYFDQEFANKKNNIMEEGLKRDLETTMKPELFGNPFAGKCDKPEDCLAFCQANPDFSACKMFASSFMTVAPTISVAKGQVEPGMRPLGGPPPCPPGQINMPRGPSRWECVDDPYWKTPESFKQCPPGHHWNEEKGFCEFDAAAFQPMPIPQPTPGKPETDQYKPGEPGQIPSSSPYPSLPINFCSPGEHWDNIRGCVREDFAKCPEGQYFDFFEKLCKDKWQSCPQGEYWDASRKSCMKDVFGPPPAEGCPAGNFFDPFKKQCVAAQWQPPMLGPGPLPRTPTCPPGLWWDSGKNSCVGSTEEPQSPSARPIPCPAEWAPVCGTDNITYSNECYAKKAGVGIQFKGECRPTETPLPSPWPGPMPTPPMPSCGNGVCEPNEYCPADCQGMPGQKTYPKPPVEGPYLAPREPLPTPLPFEPVQPPLPSEPIIPKEPMIPLPTEPMSSPPTEYTPPPLPSETPPPPPPPPPSEGEVLGVMSVREADEIAHTHSLTVFGKMWQILKAIVIKDKPAEKLTIITYLPHQVLRVNSPLKSRILWAEGNNYYRLASLSQQTQVLGVSTKRPQVPRVEYLDFVPNLLYGFVRTILFIE